MQYLDVRKMTMTHHSMYEYIQYCRRCLVDYECIRETILEIQDNCVYIQIRDKTAISDAIKCGVM